MGRLVWQKWESGWKILYNSWLILYFWWYNKQKNKHSWRFLVMKVFGSSYNSAGCWFKTTCCLFANMLELLCALGIFLLEISLSQALVSLFVFWCNLIQQILKTYYVWAPCQDLEIWIHNIIPVPRKHQIYEGELGREWSEQMLQKVSDE